MSCRWNGVEKLRVNLRSGLITGAAILPPTWDFKRVERNIPPVTEAEWDRLGLL
ncbi:hypothetical protein [Laspinema olomoucense]|uniref:Uncharacterized protein n=1 Tax=Laspinema olomoucense D3b TaxID=2953688 RepID=A0ABT2N9W5_9CYAN|nr:hypothetical protein [Laspinema sp. D3b]MCT7979367.1 hypothetical protein [Laspinema sp. D3b]